MKVLKLKWNARWWLVWIIFLMSSRGAMASPSQTIGTWSDVVQITDEPGVYWNSPRMSGDGAWVAFIGAHNNAVYLARSNGADLQTIDLPYSGRFVDINADGSVVAVAHTCAVRVYQNGAARSLLPIVTYEGRQKALCSDTDSVAISGNGQWLYYISAEPWPCTYGDDAWQCTGNQDGSREVWRINVATGDVNQVTDFNTGPDTGPWWVSTDFSGSTVAFTAGTDDHVHVYAANGDGSSVRRLAEARSGSTYYTHRNLTFISGDGRWVIFTGKNAQGFSAVSIARSDGTETRIIRDGYGCDHGPLGSDCSISYDGSIIAVSTLADTTEILDNRGNLVETLPGEEADLAYDGLHVVHLSSQAQQDLGSATDEQVFTLKRGVTKRAPLEAPIGEPMTYTVTLRHGETINLAANIIDPIPPHTAYVPNSAQATKGTISYNATQNAIAWQDTIAPQETVTLTFAITPTCTTPPPPTSVTNRMTATLGNEVLHPLAITSLSLPEKDLNVEIDEPTDGSRGVAIEADNQGPLLRWHDQNTGQACGTDPTASDVAYRVYLRAGDGTWQEVGTYPNCAREVRLQPDDLACRDNGDPANYTWKVAAHDPTFPCRAPQEEMARFQTASCRPEIEIKPTYTLDPGYFLNREHLLNRIKVDVDWNGPAYETPDTSAPYGTVTFDLNGKPEEKDGAIWGAEHTYDMGTDFNAELSCANNTLTIWATQHSSDGGYESLKTAVQPTVFPFPGWVEWAITNLPGSDASFKAEPKAPIVAYSYNFKYPEPAFEASWEPPDWIPYLGGRPLGIQETQTEAEAEGQSDGAGAVGVTGKTGLDLGVLTSEGKLWGKGDVQFVCGESLAFQRAEMGFSINATVEQEAGLTDVIPAAKAAERWPVVGRIVRWVNSIATLKGTFTPGVEITTEFVEENHELVYRSGQGTGSIEGKATLATEVCEGLTAEAYGGGTPYLTIQVPKGPDYLKEVGIDMVYGAAFQAWSFEETYERKVNCHYPGGCSEVDARSLLAHEAAPTWHLIPRNNPGPDYGIVNATIRRSVRAPQATTTTNEETILIPNAYVRSEPDLAIREDGHRLLAYVHDDTTRPQGRGTEIRALTWDGAWSTTPVALTDDAQPDYAPVAAFDDDGNGLVLWERAVLPAAIRPSLTITFAQSLEIVARTWMNDTATWSPMITLTHNTLMDHAPRLARGSEGTMMALWETTDGTDALGTADHPLTYTYALWENGSWTQPTAALSGLHDVFDADLAVYTATQAALVYVQDMDGVLSTTTDTELVYSRFDGTTWHGPTRLTDDNVTDVAPSIAYDQDGTFHLIWLRDGSLVSLTDTWSVDQVEPVHASTTEGGVLGFTLARSPGGHLALIWQSMDEDGADLTYALYDGGTATWSTRRSLMSDTDVERAHSPAFAGDGALYVAYQKSETAFITRTLSNGTTTFTVTNVPTRGTNALACLAHTVGHDLTIDSLTTQPANPGPGESVTLTAVLRNAGDLQIQDPKLAYYDGAGLIDTIQILPDLNAGATTTATLHWQVPITPTTHTLHAIADPDGEVTETDETNNARSLATTLPDLQIGALFTQQAGGALIATARLHNAGVMTATAPFTTLLRIGDPITGALISADVNYDDLTASGAHTITFTIPQPLSLASLGDKLWAVVDAGDAVLEAREDNNTAYARMTILPDLTVTAADIVETETLTITLHNTGFITASGVLLTVRAGRTNTITGTLVYSNTLARLAPQTTTSITMSTPTDDAHRLYVQLDPHNTIPEINEGNNLAIHDLLAPSQQIYLPLILKD